MSNELLIVEQQEIDNLLNGIPLQGCQQPEAFAPGNEKLSLERRSERVALATESWIAIHRYIDKDKVQEARVAFVKMWWEQGVALSTTMQAVIFGLSERDY